MSLEKRKIYIQEFRAWTQKVNSKKLYWVASGVFFLIYFYTNKSSLSIIQNLLVSVIGAALTPLLLGYIFISIGLFLAMIWLLIAPFFIWFIRWIAR
jgi:uncharacterized protein YacL